MRRRDFLRAGGLVTFSALVPGLAAGDQDPFIVRVAQPQNLETPLSYFDRLITPTEAFFVRSHFGPPALDARRKVRIEGMRSLELSVRDLRRFKEVTLTAVLQCAGNGRALHSPRLPGVQWVHGAMGQATWTGVRLADVLSAAGVPADAAHVHLEGYDQPPRPTVPRFVRSIPLARALDRSTLIAYRMNGKPLTLAHGAPLRLVAPCWAGDHWMKWLRSVRLASEEASGFYMQTAYKMPVSPVPPGTVVPPEEMRSVTVFPVKSIIGRPADGARLASGKQEVVGIAFSGSAPVARVDVSVDGGSRWEPAALEGKAEAGRWQVFRYAFAAAPGPMRVMARATDGADNVQPAQAAWNPSGYFWNAWHTVNVTAAS